MSRPRYGDNVFAIMGAVSATLRAAKWSDEKRNAALKEVTSSKSYDAAIEVCRKYITIEDES